MRRNFFNVHFDRHTANGKLNGKQTQIGGPRLAVGHKTRHLYTITLEGGFQDRTPTLHPHSGNSIGANAGWGDSSAPGP